jgi:hypothetical protein
VTTGTTGSLPSVGGLTIGSNSGKTWTGTDGKFEPDPNGGQRLKWNNFTSRWLSADVDHNTFLLTWSHVLPNQAPPHSGTWVYQANMDCQWSANADLSDRPNASDKAKVLSKLLEEVKNHDFNLGVELGQMNQTVNLLSDNLRKLGRAALALRRGDFSTAARQLGAKPKGTRLKTSDISGRWLELQYGWLPLLGSSFEAAKAFEAISAGPRSHIFVVTAARKWQRDFSLAPNNASCLLTVRVGRRIQYEMYEEMSVARQLGLLDPLSVAWELTPWSFVVDWFIPIGTYLDQLSQIPTLKGRWLVTDFMRVPKQKCFHKWNNSDFLGPWSVITGVLKTPVSLHEMSRVERVFSNTPPEVPLPKFVWGLNSHKRFWNAVSLAHGRFTK